MLNA
jgi:hypothetical protein